MTMFDVVLIMCIQHGPTACMLCGSRVMSVFHTLHHASHIALCIKKVVHTARLSSMCGLPLWWCWWARVDQGLSPSPEKCQGLVLSWFLCEVRNFPSNGLMRCWKLWHTVFAPAERPRAAPNRAQRAYADGPLHSQRPISLEIRGHTHHHQLRFRPSMNDASVTRQSGSALCSWTAGWRPKRK